MSNNDNDQWPDDQTDLPTGSTDTGDAGSPAGGDDLRDTIDGIGQDTDEILDILRDGRSTPAPRPPATRQPRPRRARNAVIDELVDDISSQVTRDLADAMPPPEAPTDEAPDRQMPPRQRDARGRWTPSQPPIPDTPTTDPAGTTDTVPPDAAATDDPDSPDRQTRRRDANGRWVRDDPPTTDISSRNQDGDSASADTEQLGRDGESPAYWDRLAGAVGQGMQDATQGVDPTIEALREAGVFKAVSWVFGSKKDKVPKEQGKHNRVVERLLKRLVGQSDDSSRSGGMGMLLLRLAPFLIAAVAAGLAAIAPAVAAALGAALATWLAVKAAQLVNDYFDSNRPENQGDKNPDGSTNKGAIGAGNRFAKGVMNAVRGSANSVNAWFGGANDYWDDGTAPDSMNRIGLKTDAVNQGGASGRPIGWLSSKYEGDYGSVARDNNGSDAYGRYQFNDKAGGLKQFFDANPQYRQHFAGLTPSTKAFGDKWKALSADPDFRAAQHHAAQLKFYDPQVANATSQGFKLDNEGVREALFSASIQHGGVAKIVNAAGQQRGFKSMSPEQQINAFYDARSRYVSGISSSRMSDNDKRNAMARYARERKDAVQAAGVTQPDPIQSQPTQQAPVTLPTSPKALAEHAEQQPAPAPTVNLGSNSTTKLIAPSMPYLPIRAAAIKLPAQPAVAQRLNTPSSPAPTSSSDDSMTQNVADRQLAHLITGGLGMGGQVG